MHKRAFSSFVMVVTGIAACFGEGPSPSGPTEATIVFTVPLASQNSSCSSSVYIGGVAFGSGSDAYAVTVPYMPTSGCNGGGGGGASSLYSFAKVGGRSNMIENLGNVMGSGVGSLPRLAANAVSVFWAIVGGITIGTPTKPTLATVPQMGGAGGAFVPAGLVATETSIYLATYTTSNTSAEDPESPRYPYGGMMSSDLGTGGLYRVPTSGSPVSQIAATPHFYFASMPDKLVTNGSALFYLEHQDMTQSAIVTRVDLDGAGSASAPQMSTPFALDGKPFGLAADHSHVAWSTTIDFGQFSTSGAGANVTESCSIWVRDLGAPVTQRVALTTSKFSCLGVAVDVGAVYFTIAHVDTSDFAANIHGDGIGRIGFDGTFSSIATGVQGTAAGARRIYLDGEDMYLVDPFAIVKISKHALDGKVEIGF